MRVECKSGSHSQQDRRPTCRRSAALWLGSWTRAASCSIVDASDFDCHAGKFFAFNRSAIEPSSINRSSGNVRSVLVKKAVKLPLSCCKVFDDVIKK